MSAAASLGRIGALATTGLRQAVRDKLLYVLAGFCAVLIVGSILVSTLTVGERGRIVMDLGLSGTQLLTVLTAIFVSINQASREIERRTIDTILAKPVTRWEFLSGRALGMAATLGLMIAVMSTLHACVLVSVGAYSSAMWSATVLAFVEAVLVASMALFFSTFTTPVPSMFITLGFTFVGHTSWGLPMLAARLQSPLAIKLLESLYVALPNLELLNVRAQVVHGVPVPVGAVLVGAAYGLAYSGVLLVLGAGILSRRDLA